MFASPVVQDHSGPIDDAYVVCRPAVGDVLSGRHEIEEESACSDERLEVPAEVGRDAAPEFGQ
jgi:hypothetical protein